ncbi:MAG: energy transducer TonB [Elusimicrobia bacterium]|nr:energy transducer TonB [Elusimicrobiota bacterium]
MFADRELGLSLSLSVGFHIGLFLLYIYLITNTPKADMTTVTDVDLILPAFLKMALPQLPARAMQEPVIKEDRKLNIPRMLEERQGRVETRSELKMALSQKSMNLAEAAAKNIAHRETGQVPMAAALEFEEIGARRAPALPADLTMENTGLPTFKPKTLGEVNAFVAEQRRRPVAPAGLAPQAVGTQAASGSGGGSRVSSMFSAPALDFGGGGQGGSPRGRAKVEPLAAAPAPARQKKPIEQITAPSRPVEITGPLSQRKVVRMSLPPYPSWAKDQGILEAAVSIRFNVSRDGRVLPDMRIERSSGYGALDRLAMDALKNWVFAPVDSGPDKQWGVITFRFVLE